MEISARGYNGTVTFDGHFVTIAREGAIAVAQKGRSEKRIPLSQITAVQWKPATRLNNGFISFTIAGARERNSRLGRQLQQAMTDENSVVIRHKHTADMQAVRDAIDAAIADRENGGQSTPTGADQLSQLADLHQQGVLTDEEFAAAKAKALGL